MTNDSELRRGTLWVGLASGLSGALDLVTIVACLWLWVSPAELGIATIATALFYVIERVATLGLGAAAVRGGDRAALSSIVWTSVAMALVVFAGSIVAAPLVGRAFDHPIIGTLLCVFAAKLIVQTVHLVPEALLRRDLRFDTLSKVRIAATLADTAAKFVTAYLGAHGYPSLRVACFVVGPLANAAVQAIGFQWVRPWCPSLVFDRGAARAALRFGVQLSLADILYLVYTSADYVVIGRVFGDVAVGAYRLAYEMVLDVVRLVSMVSGEVAFPAFARVEGAQDARAGELLVQFTRRNLLAIAPLLVVIGVAAADLLAILYPPLNAAAATAVRILCVVGSLRAASFVLPPMLAGLGHSRDALLYNVAAAIVCPAGFVIAAHGWPELGYLAVAWAWAATYPLAFALLLSFVVARTGVRIGTYLCGVLPVLAWAAVTTPLVYVVRDALPPSHWLRLIVTAAVTIACFAPLVVAVSRRRSSGLRKPRTGQSQVGSGQPPTLDTRSVSEDVRDR